MEEVVHLMFIIPVLHYVGHLINTPVQIVRDVDKFHPSEIVGSRGPDPGLEVKVCQKTPILLALSEVTYLRRPKSHPKQYGRLPEPSFRTQRESR